TAGGPGASVLSRPSHGGLRGRPLDPARRPRLGRRNHQRRMASGAKPAVNTAYRDPFWIDAPVGNNAFSFSQRGPHPRIFVPSLIAGTIADVKPGSEIAFEEVDDDGRLRSCSGLAHLVRTTWQGVPTVVVDNHNHAFYFWFEACLEGRL